MAEFLNMRLRKLVVCAICLERFDTPKQLSCNHHFCKQCLEGIMNFNKDGSGTIVCPLRCTTITWISANKTVNDLPVSYEFKSMVEVFESEEEDSGDSSPVTKCKYMGNCNKKVSIYCCGEFTCKSCHIEHMYSCEDQSHKRSVEVLFNRKDNKLKILCEKHSSGCTHVCCTDSLLCVYCLKRDNYHRGHEKKSIEEEAKSIAEILLHGSVDRSNIQKFAEYTKIKIEALKRELKETLQRRKEECLSKYFDIVSNEEETLRNEFDALCHNHMEQYKDYVPETFPILDNQRRSDIELVVQKRDLLRFPKNVKTELISDIIGLSEKSHFLGLHPLGELQLYPPGKLLTTFSPVPTFIYQRPSDSKLSAQQNDTSLTIDITSSSEKSNILGILDGPNNTTKSDKEKTFQEQTSPNIRSGLLEIPSAQNGQAFLDISINGSPCNRIILTLDSKNLPKTCENFSQLCTHQQGFGYRGTKFHYLNSSSYIVGGSITSEDSKDCLKGRSIYGDNFKKENFTVKHDAEGVVSMFSSRGFVGSTFLITMKALPEKDGYNVAFGKVTDETFPIVQAISNVGGNHTPLKEVLIVNSGLL